MSPYSHELHTIHAALNLVEERLKRITYEGLKVQIKSDGSPVTNADLEVNQIVHDALLTTFPGDAWLSEESPDNASRLQSSRVWILDPIDGPNLLLKPYLITRSRSLSLTKGNPPSASSLILRLKNIFAPFRGNKLPSTVNLFTSAQAQIRSRLTFLVNPWQINQAHP